MRRVFIIEVVHQIDQVSSVSIWDEKFFASEAAAKQKLEDLKSQDPKTSYQLSWLEEEV